MFARKFALCSVTAIAAAGTLVGVASSPSQAHNGQPHAVCKGTESIYRLYSAGEDCNPGITNASSIKIQWEDPKRGRLCIRAQFLIGGVWQQDQDCTSNNGDFFASVGGGAVVKQVRNVRVWNDDNHVIKGQAYYYD